MALADQVALAELVEFQKAVRLVIVEAARSYVNAGKDTIVKESRYNLARSVLIDGGLSQLNAFVYAYASFNTLTAANYTTNIFGFTSKVFNNLAGLLDVEA